MKYVVVLMSLFLFSGCAVLKPNFATPKEEKKIIQKKKIVENNTSVHSNVVEQNVTQEVMLEEGELIVNVFDDELYFEKDKVGKDKTKVVIKYLDAFTWEKRALKNAYWKGKLLWSKKQSKEFRKVLEEDKYLALCADRRYWDNLEFEESEPERDILQSILLIKYLNNLSHGCPKWVESNGKIKDENIKEDINTKELFSLLSHGVIIEKLLFSYVPKEKEFHLLLKKHKNSLELAKKKEVLKSERLEIELNKCKECQPNYKKKRK